MKRKIVTNLESKSDKVAEHSAALIYQRIADHKIIDAESYVLMGELVKEAKKIVLKFDDETDPEINQAHKLHKALISRRNRWAEKFQEAEKLGKEKLNYFRQGQEWNLPILEGIVFTERWVGEVVDEALIPAEYKCVDIDKLKERTDVFKDETNIPGWKVSKKRVVTIRS